MYNKRNHIETTDFKDTGIFYGSDPKPLYSGFKFVEAKTHHRNQFDIDKEVDAIIIKHKVYDTLCAVRPADSKGMHEVLTPWKLFRVSKVMAWYVDEYYEVVDRDKYGPMVSKFDDIGLKYARG